MPPGTTLLQVTEPRTSRATLLSVSCAGKHTESAELTIDQMATKFKSSPVR